MEFKRKFPEVNMHKIEHKIKDSFDITSRKIYKTKGNEDIILKMFKFRDLTVNQIAKEIKMTRQGVRFHIHNLESKSKINKIGLTGRNNILYRGIATCWSV